MRNLFYVVICFLMCFMLAGCSETNGSESNSSHNSTASEITTNPDDMAFTLPSMELEELQKIDTGITNTLIEVGYTVEHSTSIHQILNTVGINDIVIQSMTGTPEEGLNAVVCFPNGYTDDDRRFYFTTENGILFYAGFLDEDLYDSDKGGFIKNYGEVHIPEKEVSIEVFEELRELAINEVKSCLKHPKTSNFGDFDWAIGRSDDKYLIIGKVSAKNGFGVPNDIHFEVWYVDNGNSFVCEGVAFNGNRIK